MNVATDTLRTCLTLPIELSGLVREVMQLLQNFISWKNQPSRNSISELALL